MNDVQKYLLKLVEEIDQICTKHDIEYYIFAGSMLGVERNEGFLPWDDDMDIVMTRDNYEKFRSIIADELKPNRAFEERAVHEEYPLPFGKYTSTDTANMTKSLSFGDCAAGLWIDIMHLAPMPVEEKKRKWVRNTFPVYCELYNRLYIGYTYRWEGFYWRYSALRLLSKLIGRERVLNHIKKKLDAIPEEGCRDYYLYHALDADFRVFSKECFGTPVKKEYEGVMLNVSPKNRKLCREAYGDGWMIVPKIDDQVVHATITDCERPYTLFKRDFMQFFKPDEIKNMYEETKKFHIKWCYKRKAMAESTLMLDSELTALETEAAIADYPVSPEKLIDENRYEEIGELFKTYITVQWQDEIKNNNIFVPISDSSLLVLMKYLMYYKQQFHSANRLLNLRKNAPGYDPERFAEVENNITLLRELSVALWDDQDYDKVYEICRDHKALWEKHAIKDFAHAFCISALETGREECDVLIEYCENMILNGDDSGVPQKILGDIYYRNDNKEEALDQYGEAAARLRNGLLLLDANKAIKELTYDR